MKKTKLIKIHFKPNRRIYCGRNHAVMSDILKVVTLSKGGGKQIIDVSKDTTYEDLEKQTLYLFFSKGRSKAQNRHAAVRPESFFLRPPLEIHYIDTFKTIMD